MSLEPSKQRNSSCQDGTVTLAETSIIIIIHFALVKLYMIRRFSFIFCQLHMCNEQVESYVLKDNMLVTSDSTEFSFAVLDEDRAQTLPSANL